MNAAPLRFLLPIVVQVAGGVGMFGALAFLPPDRGRMLVIPLGATAAATVLPRALASGATLIAAGPLPHSYIVDGIHSQLRAAVGRALIVAAPAAGCGPKEDGA